MNQEMMEQVAKISAETAVQAAMAFLEQENQKRQKQKRDRRLRNTKLLLRNYRSFALHCQDVKSHLESIADPELLDELDTEDFAVEAIQKSKRRTLAMMNYIQKMLTVYRILCEQTGRQEEIRRYQTIHLLYVAEEKVTAEYIAECHNVDVRTVYRDAKEATKALASLIFGVDGLRMAE